MALPQPAIPHRTHIVETDAKRWARHFGVTTEFLEAAIGKVGTSVDAVHREIKRRRLRLEQKKVHPNREKTTRDKPAKPMEMQPSNEGAVAHPMASATSQAAHRQRSMQSIPRNQAEHARKKALKKQRAAQKR